MPPSARRVYPLNIPGLGHPAALRVHARPDRFISRAIAERGVWEPFETAVFLDLVRPGGVVVDVGANIGYYAVLAAQRAGPAGRVHAFEPERANFRLLQANLRLNACANASARRLAICDRAGTERLYRDADNLGDHRLYPSPGAPRSSVPVPTAALDALFPAGTRLDVIKIDAQGAEYRIFRGMRGLLARRTAALRIITEVWPHGLAHAGSSHRALLALLAEQGLRPALIDEAEARLTPVTYAALEGLLAGPWYAQGQGFVNLLLE